MRPNPQETADLVTLTEEILNGKLPLFCSDFFQNHSTFFLDLQERTSPSDSLLNYKFGE